MKRNYYCLISGLPVWKLDDRKPSFTSTTFREELEKELSPADIALVRLLYLPYDHLNILNRLYMKETDFDARGNYSQETVDLLANAIEFDNALEDNVAPGVEPYLIEFSQRFHQADEKPLRMSAEKELVTSWYEKLLKSKNKFLSGNARFELDSRNVMTALLGRKFNLPVADALVGDMEFLEQLKRNRSRDFGLTGEIENLDQLLQIFDMTNLQERELRMDILRWSHYEEATFFDYFNIDKILSLVLKLFIVERWNALDEEQGRVLFKKLIADLQSSYEFPEEYKLSHGKKI